MYSPRVLFSLMTTYNSWFLWQNLSLAWDSTNSLAWLARERQELLSHLHLVITLITNTFHCAWPFECGFWNSYLNACKGIILLSESSSSAQIYRSLLEQDVMVTQLTSFLNIYCEPIKYQMLNTEDGMVVSPTLPDPSSSSSLPSLQASLSLPSHRGRGIQCFSIWKRMKRDKQPRRMGKRMTMRVVQ